MDKAGRILVVEDDEQLGDLYRQALAASGYEVDLAGNGRAALSLYAASAAGPGPYDVVIMDMNMPEMDGRATLERLLALDGKAKVIIATGSAMDAATGEELGAKAFGMILKPFSLTTLFREVAKAVA